VRSGRSSGIGDCERLLIGAILLFPFRTGRLLVGIVLSYSIASAASGQVVATQSAESEPAATQDAVGGEEDSNEFDLLKNERLTGNWWGVRPFLEERGITFDFSATLIYQQNAHGGLRTLDAGKLTGSYDLELTLDTEAMKLWKGGKLYVYGEGEWGQGVSRYVGDLFGVNGDVMEQETIQVSELWYEQALLDKKLRVRFGKVDLRVDFETNAFANDIATQFFNNALINAPNVPLPDRGQGIQFVATPTDWFYFGAGVADAEADARETGFKTAYHSPCDLFSIYEFGFTPVWDTGWGKLPGNYRSGLWYDPQPKEKFFDDLGGRRKICPTRSDDVGFYTSLDQVILRENPQEEGDEQGLGVFARYAYAHEDVNTIEHFWSVGAQYQGLIPTRDDDVLAFGVAQGILSRDLRLIGADPHRETALELYYRIQLLGWLTLTPDFQWILRPDGENGHDAFVAGLRVQMAF
jgi:porin